MITENMRNFIGANSFHLVVEGEHLTPEFTSIETLEDMARSDKTKYKLENGEVFVITTEEKKSVDYAPKWLIE